MEEEKKEVKQKEETSIKETSLKELREEIDTLEEKLSKAKRDQLIISQERSPTKEIYSWTAPERIQQAKDKNWLAKVIGISVVSVVLAVLTNTLLLVVAVIAVVAVLYAESVIPAKIFNYTILNKGLKAGSKVYAWKQIPEFWITKRGKNIILSFNVHLDNEQRLSILVGDGNINIIAKELIQYIDYLDPSEVKRDIFIGMVEGQHIKLGEVIEEDMKQQPIKEKPIYTVES